jgi:hypothetical protein
MNKIFWKADSSLIPILRICLAPDSNVEPLLREWEKANSVDVIDGGLIRYIPFLYRRFLDLKIEPRDNYILRGAYFKSWWAQTVFQRENLEFLFALDYRFPEFALLKGTALQHSVYASDPRTRPCDDVDILVDPCLRHSAAAYLIAEGFRLDSVYTLDYVMNFRKSAPFVKGGISIDLNWGLYEYSRNFDSFSELDFQRIKAGPNEVKILSDTDNLIHSIIHGSGWNPVPTTRWILDAALLIKRGSIDWDKFANKVIKNGWQYPLLDQLNYLVELGISIPDSTRMRILTSKPDPWGKAMYFYQRQPRLIARRILRFLYADYLMFITVNQLKNSPARYLLLQRKVLKNFILQYIHAKKLK